jgi:hypothetical protein
VEREKWKEGDQGPSHKKSRGIQRKSEAKTMHFQKNGTKKEDLKKKTLSRNRPFDSIQMD